MHEIWSSGQFWSIETLFENVLKGPFQPLCSSPLFSFVLAVPRMYGVYKYPYMDKSVGSYVKFRYSEKATKFWHYLNRKTIAIFFQIFVALSEYLNFTEAKKIHWIGLIMFGLGVWDSGIGKLTIGYNKKIRLPKYSYPSMSHSSWSYVS